MHGEARQVPSTDSRVNGHASCDYDTSQPKIMESTALNGDLATNVIRMHADTASGSESTGDTSSEIAGSERDEERDEIHEYIYFDEDDGETPRVDHGSSRNHEVQTAPLFTSSALEYMKMTDKTSGVRTQIQTY